MQSVASMPANQALNHLRELAVPRPKPGEKLVDPASHRVYSFLVNRDFNLNLLLGALLIGAAAGF